MRLSVLAGMMTGSKNIFNGSAKGVSKRGFTLIEILLVTSLLSVIGISFYHALEKGLTIYKRGSQSFIDEDVAIALDKIAQDVRNTFSYSKIPFTGKERRLTIPTVVQMPVDAKIKSAHGQLARQIGSVEYFFENDALYRRQANYSQALKKKFGPARILIKGVKEVGFYYHVGNENTAEQRNIELVPSILVVEITVQEGKNQRSISRAVNIPVSRSEG